MKQLVNLRLIGWIYTLLECSSEHSLGENLIECTFCQEALDFSMFYCLDEPQYVVGLTFVFFSVVGLYLLVQVTTFFDQKYLL